MSVEFVGIELDLRGEEEVYNDLLKIDRLINSLGGKKKLDIGLNQLKRDLVAARGELEKLQRLREKYEKAGGKGNAFLDEISDAKHRVNDLNQAMREVRASASSMGDTFKRSFNRANSVITHVGSKMQSLGNALTRLTSPFQRLTTGLLYGAGYKALNTITAGFSDSFARADTLNKYTKLMKEYETANYSAVQSRQELDASIQGLPIALNDAISMAQRYTLSLGDMEKGTKLAIATNNAFLASMATETQRYQGMLQLQDLMNGKDLQPREWMSLGSSMGKAINEIGKELGYGTDELGKFRQELYAGNIATNDFLNALIKVGTGEGALVGLAKISAETWEGLFSNVKIATARMGANIIETLNETFKDASGRTLLQQLLGRDAEGNEIGGGIKHWIDDVSKSIQGWIKAHPEEILNFFNQLKNFDWRGLGRGLAQGMGELARLLQMAMDFLGNRDMQNLGRRMVRLSMLGRMLTIFGGVLKGISGLPASAYATIKTLRRAAGAGGLAGALGELFGGKGKDIGKTADDLGKVGGSMGKFSLGLSKVFKGWAEIATMIGGSAFVAWGSMKLFKGAFKELGEITEIISEIDWVTGGNALLMMADWVVALAGAGNLIMKSGLAKDLGIGMLITGLMTTFASATFFADMALIKKGFKAIDDATKYINSAIANLEKVKEVPDGVMSKVESAMGVFNQITDLLAIERNNPVTGEGTNGLKELDNKSAKTVKNLANALKSMVSAINDLNTINGIKIDAANIEANMTALGTALSHVGTMLVDMPAILKSGESVKWAEQISAVMKNLNKAFKSITASDGILTSLGDITAKMEGLDKSAIETQFKRLGETLTSIRISMQGIGTGTAWLENMVNLREGLKNMKFAIKHLNEIGSIKVNTQGISNIETVINGLKNVFTGVAVTDLVTQINTFVTSVKEAMASLDELNKEHVIEATIKLSPGFKKSVNKVTKEITSARSRIYGAWRSIPTTLSKTVTINVTVRSVVSGISKAVANVGSGINNALGRIKGRHDVFQATGGMIYRAGGGGVPFRSKGTDTVPAMLTPGEYVHRKQAVNYFGIDFMRKINSLDVQGAMSDLMIRAGSMAGAGRSTTINNNYYNNQRVVQNIRTNSPDFAFRTASRFVGAF